MSADVVKANKEKAEANYGMEKIYEWVKAKLNIRSVRRRSIDPVVDFITVEEAEKQRYEHEIKLWREFYNMAITQCHPEMVGIVLAERRKDCNYIQEKYGKATVS